MSVVNDLYVKKRNVTWLERKIDHNEGRDPMGKERAPWDGDLMERDGP